MSSAKAVDPGDITWPRLAASLSGSAASIAIYSLFAAIICLVQGTEPPLALDHLAYFRMADDVARLHPDGAYWRSITPTQSYGVLLAYLRPLTGSHVASLKVLLAAMTLSSLLAFELLVGLACKAKWKVVLIALVSGFFVTFGASFWGYTDFSASLQRTAMIPVAILIVWFWLAHDSPVRLLVFPVLVACTFVHLSAYYLAGILGLVETWDWIRRRLRLDPRLLVFGVMLVISYAMVLGIDRLFASTYSTILTELRAEAEQGPAGTRKPAQPASAAAGPGQAQGSADGRLAAKTAWEIELSAFPWRNMPLPFTTLATIAASYGVILAVAVAGGLRARRAGLTELDRGMIAFAGAVVAFSYGPQTLLWALRQMFPIYPFGIEEVRAINLIMIPSLYFAFRLADSLWEDRSSANGRLKAGTVVLLLVIQPLDLLKVLPLPAREGLLGSALHLGVIRQDDTPRLVYARHLLRLPEPGPRFYYSAQGVLDWLRSNASVDTRVLSTLDELVLVDLSAIGPFNTVLAHEVTSPGRKRWAESAREVRSAISSHDLTEVEAVARKYGADYAVVPWAVSGAVYRDQYFSIVPTKI